ncbi:hypothetical protein SCLCIDRAFT_947432 [Scleroderma citrinum Foug A]|uniref:Uncharacterized protein n=1 Tax=Scleroderma citrinum Foug A TaxID=1036808 RepID=A0A0C3DW38_9AGAM|nr:hypothetical protein SCLCIDRAFT_947432 [Scleroderma citrinum Foug A]
MIPRPGKSATTAFTVFKTSRLEYVVRNLLHSEANTFCNILTITSNLYVLFDRFDFWLEEVLAPVPMSSLHQPGQCSQAVKAHAVITLLFSCAQILMNTSPFQSIQT